MFEWLNSDGWTQTTWIRWGFGLTLVVVAYYGGKAVDELKAIRKELEAIRHARNSRN